MQKNTVKTKSTMWRKAFKTNVFENPTLKKGTVIIYTCIGNAMSSLPRRMIKLFGLSKMYPKAKSLFNKKGHDLFYGMLYKYGVRKVCEYRSDSNFEKTYGFFTF